MEFLSRLQTPFPPQQVQRREQGGNTLYYIAINHVIERFNQACGARWTSKILSSELTSQINVKNQRIEYLAKCSLGISIEWEEGESTKQTTREGVGADISFDPDTAVKTSLAEAFKKAGHAWGVGLELWSPARRAYLAHLGNYELLTSEQVKTGLTQALDAWSKELPPHSPFLLLDRGEKVRAFLTEAYLDKQAIDRLRTRYTVTEETQPSTAPPPS